MMSISPSDVSRNDLSRNDLSPRNVSDATAATPETAVAAALLRCIGRWGLTKTTVEDVAREAGVSRATVYRLFPGGKQAITAAAGIHVIEGLLAALDEVLDAAPDAESAIVGLLHRTATLIAADEVWAYLSRHEPETVAHLIAFDRLDPLLATAEVRIGPRLDRFVPGLGPRVAAWLARILASYIEVPSATVDLTDAAAVTSFVRTFVLPAIERAATPATTHPPVDDHVGMSNRSHP